MRVKESAPVSRRMEGKRGREGRKEETRAHVDVVQTLRLRDDLVVIRPLNPIGKSPEISSYVPPVRNERKRSR